MSNEQKSFLTRLVYYASIFAGVIVAVFGVYDYAQAPVRALETRVDKLEDERVNPNDIVWLRKNVYKLLIKEGIEPVE